MSIDLCSDALLEIGQKPKACVRLKGHEGPHNHQPVPTEPIGLMTPRCENLIGGMGTPRCVEAAGHSGPHRYGALDDGERTVLPKEQRPPEIKKVCAAAVKSKVGYEQRTYVCVRDPGHAGDHRSDWDGFTWPNVLDKERKTDGLGSVRIEDGAADRPAGDSGREDRDGAGAEEHHDVSMGPKCTCPGGPLIGLSKDCPAHGLMVEHEHEWYGAEIRTEPLRAEQVPGGGIGATGDTIVGERRIIGWRCKECPETREMSQDEYHQWRKEQDRKAAEADRRARQTLKVREAELEVSKARQAVLAAEQRLRQVECGAREEGHDMVMGEGAWQQVCSNCGHTVEDDDA